MGMINKVGIIGKSLGRIWRNPVRQEMRSFEPLDDFYNNGKKLGCLGILSIFVVEPTVVLPFLLLGYAVTHIIRKRAEANLIKDYQAEFPERPIEPYYGRKNILLVGGFLAALNLASVLDRAGQPHVLPIEPQSKAFAVDKAKYFETTIQLKDLFWETSLSAEVSAELPKLNKEKNEYEYVRIKFSKKDVEVIREEKKSCRIRISLPLPYPDLSDMRALRNLRIQLHSPQYFSKYPYNLEHIIIPSIMPQ